MDKKSSCQIKYYVNGMHCASCETLIEKELRSWKGVKNVKADLKTKEVTLTLDSPQNIPDTSQLNNSFDELGYTFNKFKTKEKSLSQKDIIITVGFASVFILVFLLLKGNENSVFSLNLDSSSSVFGYFTFGLIAGFSSCAALVGGLLLSLSKKWNDVYGGNKKKSKVPFALFITGRMISFALLGGLLGLLGAVIQISPLFTTVMIIIVSVVMIILGLQMVGFEWAEKLTIKSPKKLSGFITNETNFKGKYMPFVVGFLTFFIPCGFTLIAQSNALLSGSFIISSFNMFAFALGTLPMLLLLSFTSIKLFGNPKVSRQFSLFAGIVVIFFGIYTMYSQLSLYGVGGIKVLSGSTEKVDVSGSISDQNKFSGKNDDSNNPNVQIMKMTADGFAYYPRQISLKAGIPVKWEIDNKGTDGCASVVYAPGLYSDTIYLQPGLNIVNIPAPQPGTYKISCAMGMVPPVTVNVN